ncbi:hypothetical protein QNA08_00590 [Chelatococcus sp. SYSU_G07232]|uniref:Periplasmic protein-like protein n=1 Tax=Chelatococcus albus TaxID=3047466 RepID=A0ABT7ACE1_9HYPH|nr:hypothetical protein [Chelatococcus sp. SYSU_G07232]MDJ1156745.1 hypothetical protein [Chelatococcus sp. SYSU_G07232]
MRLHAGSSCCWIACTARLLLALAVLGGAWPATAGDMRFRLEPINDRALCSPDCPFVLMAEGQITLETAEALQSFLRRELAARPANLVFIDSPGGSVAGAVKLGAVFRGLGTTVVVARPLNAPAGRTGTRFLAARCYSSCVYALMGGADRVIPRGSRVGVHRMHRLAFEPATARAGIAAYVEFASRAEVDALSRYAREMGVDPGLIMLAEKFSPGRLRVLSPREIRRFHLARERL